MGFTSSQNDNVVTEEVGSSLRARSCPSHIPHRSQIPIRASNIGRELRGSIRGFKVDQREREVLGAPRRPRVLFCNNVTDLIC